MMTQDLKNRNIAILTEDGFEEIELSSPRKALDEAGATTHIVSPHKDKVRAKEGDEWTKDYIVDKTLEETSAEDYDALMIPGGVINPDKLRVNEKALAFVKAFFAAGKPVAAICHGPQVLIDAEVVKGRSLTSVKAIRKDLINAGANWEDEEVVADQGLITSRTPKDLPAFNKKIVEAFSGRQARE